MFSFSCQSDGLLQTGDPLGVDIKDVEVHITRFRESTETSSFPLQRPFFDSRSARLIYGSTLTSLIGNDGRATFNDHANEPDPHQPAPPGHSAATRFTFSNNATHA